MELKLDSYTTIEMKVDYNEEIILSINSQDNYALSKKIIALILEKYGIKPFLEEFIDEDFKDIKLKIQELGIDYE